ncbi:unnamed protein product [Didymodactylos carnosus]|uniref:Uncharacterized protein n=1 Tax=Didymodactylos carnosus TaxID=1234261 RepID=A0A8S2ERA5_9BILA|nr:unnamed protein product [Didymodactylos carnosus]CAF4093507.1 unnamed protein product [Didymodactylos carnosus]
MFYECSVSLHVFEGVCDCDAEFYWNDDRCSLQRIVDQPCVTSVMCASNMTCLNHRCYCNLSTSYINPTTNACLFRKGFRQLCKAHNECVTTLSCVRLNDKDPGSAYFTDGMPVHLNFPGLSYSYCLAVRLYPLSPDVTAKIIAPLSCDSTSTYIDQKGYGNFHKHLTRRGAKEYEQNLKSTANSQSELESDTDSQYMKYKQEEINEAITTNLIIKCNLPAAIVEHQGFRNFMSLLAPKWKPTSARNIKQKMIPALLLTVQKCISEMLKEVKYFTVDVWIDVDNQRGRAFMGITGHYIDSVYKPQALLLDIVRLQGSHSAEHIRNTTKQILDRLSINHKVYKIITDNGSSMIKAYKFGLSVNDQDFEDEEANDEGSMDVDEQKSIISWKLIDWHDREEDGVDYEKGKRLSCSAHILQLTIRDGLRNVPHISKTLAKCKVLTRKSHKSRKLKEMLEETFLASTDEIQTD